MSNILAKSPCLNCREKHQRCDRRLPKCKRCEIKGLDCKPVQRRQVFRLGSTAKLDSNFRHDQTWVNSQPRNWRPPAGSDRVSQCRSTLFVASNHSKESPPPSEPRLDPHTPDTPGYQPQPEHIFDGSSPIGVAPRPGRWSENLSPRSSSDDSSSIQSIFGGVVETEGNRLTSPDNNTRTGEDPRQLIASDHIQHAQVFTPLSVHRNATKSSSHIQESCLMRYFIEELSPWFDHCDERRHFQLVVPLRAENCLALRNAVFAVSARHLCRLPHYLTPQGISYHGQLLPQLTKTTSLEYLLKCIPELVRFHEIEDPTHQENIMAATVILRQYEEMEEELEEGEIGNYANERVNFLAITHTIINTMISTPHDHSLTNAAFWITARQDVYCALTRQRPPEFRFGSETLKPSAANTMIIFASEVAKWRWGSKAVDEWELLKARQHELDNEYMHELAPLLERKAEPAKGSIFPTIWFSFEAHVTAVQHFKLGEMILIAESPYLEKARSAVHRKAEAQVREIVLSLCGIATSHPRCHPALVNAVIAITLYGEYFTRQDERTALLGIIDQTMDLHAWPMRKAYQTLNQQWEMIDSLQY